MNWTTSLPLEMKEKVPDVHFRTKSVVPRARFEPEVRRYGHILEVHVKKDYQGMGIATEMLEYATTDLKKRGVEVVSNNAKTCHLYEKMGFREFGRTLHFKKALI